MSDPTQHSMPGALDELDFAADPIAQFQRWMAEAIAAGVPMPEAMTLATATPDGKPSARMVLLKGCDERGFVFHTSYRSRKARELDANPHAALVFHWLVQERQIRVEGVVERTTAAESDVYFRTRPLDSRLSAWASPQSEIIKNRQQLEIEWQLAAKRFAGDDVPCPPFWGGYRLRPEIVEFWQGMPGRLHDRLRYRGRDPWRIERLAP